MSFIDDKDTGREGEQRVRLFLEGAGYIVEEIGQDLGKWRSKDNAGDYTAPDFKVTGHKQFPSKELVGKTLEVKADRRSHETGNAYLEILANVGTGRQGWSYTTNADFVGYLSLGDSQLCIVPMRALREKLAAIWHGFKSASATDERMGGLAHSLGILVPMEELRKISLWHGKIP